MFALIDVNNFYVSCERVFQPQLKNKPLIVLSNNDGCAISRSDEAKQIGVKMGETIQNLDVFIRNKGLLMRSANFTLYGDMSQRVMDIIESLSPNIEVYSIDEAFVEIGNYSDCDGWAKKLRSELLKQTGLPTSIGVGRTKVLAKLANSLAKKSDGVYVLNSVDEQQVLKSYPVEELWGVGWRTSAQLIDMDITSAWQLAQTDGGLIRKRFSIMLLNIKQELLGQSVLALDTLIEPRKGVLVSRSFGMKVTDQQQLRLSVIKFIEEGSVKLRKQNSVAGMIRVFIRTKPQSKNDRQYTGSAEVKLIHPSSNSSVLRGYALRVLEQIYKPGYKYKKAGIMLSNLSDAAVEQYDLFSESKQSNTDQVKDQINKKYGKMMLKPAVLISKNQQWKMRRNYLSAAYTTDWNQILVVK